MKTKNGKIEISFIKFIYLFILDQIEKLHNLHRIMARGSTSPWHMQHKKLTTTLVIMIK
jgi:hypothetical protein